MTKNWAIAIGVNQYENMPTLKYAQRDAELMRDYFLNEAGFEKVYLFTDDSPQITDAGKPFSSQPTYATLKRFLRVRFNQSFLSTGDNLWFFFSGHGLRHADRDYLMPSDADPHPEGVEDTAIAMNYVTERLRRCGADNVVLILDACRNEQSSRGLGVGEEKQKGVITIASCSPAERSYEIEDLQQGSFTYALLESLLIQGEGNCATVERMYQRLCYRVPEINRQYNKPRQTPYAIVEPATKSHLILLPRQATLQDIATLKLDAFEAEGEGQDGLAEQLWRRILTVSPADPQALKALRRIWSKPKPSPPQPEPDEVKLQRQRQQETERVKQLELQKQREQEEYENKLRDYEQEFSQAVEGEYPLSKDVRNFLNSLQQSNGLRNEDVAQIEQPILAQADAKYQEKLKEEEAERQRQQEAERVKQLELQKQREQEEYENKLRDYEQEFSQAVEGEYPLSKDVRNFLNSLQQSNGLRNEDVAQIEQPILAQADAKYQEKLKEEEAQRQRLQPEVELLSEIGVRYTQEEEMKSHATAPSSTPAPSRKPSAPPLPSQKRESSDSQKLRQYSSTSSVSSKPTRSPPWKLIGLGGVAVSALLLVVLNLSNNQPTEIKPIVSQPSSPRPTPSPTSSSTTSPTAEDFYAQANKKLEQEGDYSGAIEDYNQAIRINPNYANAYNFRGLARLLLGEYQAAIEDFNSAIRINPDYADAYNNRGAVRKNLGEYQAAIEDYSEAIRINPNDANAYYNRGNARFDLKQYQEAIEDYSEAIRINPNSANAYHRRGLARLNLGDKQSAISDFQKAADLYQQQGNEEWSQKVLVLLRLLQQ